MRFVRGRGSVLLLLMAASVGCRLTRSEPITEQPTADLDTARLDAVVAVGDGGSNEILFGIRDARPAGWSSAPVVRVPSAIGTGPVGPSVSMSAIGAVDSLHRPLLVVLRSQVAERPYVRVAVLEVGRGRAEDRESDVLMRPCVGGNWLAAFFVEGLGPPPQAPAMVRYRVADSTVLLRVDPARHTVRASPTLVLNRADVDRHAELRARGSLSVRPSSELGPVMPLIVWTDGQRWRGAGGTGNRGQFGMSFNERSQRDQILTWRFYLFEAPPPC